MKLAIHGVGKRLPACIEHIVRYTDGAPRFVSVTGSNQHTNFCGCRFVGIQDTNLEISQLNVVKALKRIAESEAQCAVERANRPTPFRGSCFRLSIKCDSN